MNDLLNVLPFSAVCRSVCGRKRTISSKLSLLYCVVVLISVYTMNIRFKHRPFKLWNDIPCSFIPFRICEYERVRSCGSQSINFCFFEKNIEDRKFSLSFSHGQFILNLVYYESSTYQQQPKEYTTWNPHEHNRHRQKNEKASPIYKKKATATPRTQNFQECVNCVWKRKLVSMFMLPIFHVMTYCLLSGEKKKSHRCWNDTEYCLTIAIPRSTIMSIDATFHLP